ncbi:hypothetical protein C0Q70_00468 [Pomacea canaliculata]|uniref:Mitochondrial import receptor subunit TOM22 homolog n=1 Tax=Pomacea canaliculata TaxID=400727 RepID=A0A2T7PWQ6_POMCA|nr:mitochondrial import receptor subunit TOM22 homolog [Pomacea canaliculata]PVD37866.1 hypothetical protein C0Q70_00468 [Pomacea canaliculata]
MATDNVMQMSIRSLEETEEDEDLDETLSERLWGLTEMFPGPVQKFFAHFIGLSGLAFKTSYSFGRNALWILASSATIMVLPVVFESERAQQQEQQLQQQRQILLGPNAAVSGTGSQNLLPGIGMMTPGMMGSK